MSARVTIPLLSLSLVACDPGGTKTPDQTSPEPFVVRQPFPSRDRLDEIAKAEPPTIAPKLERGPSTVATWTMAEDLPTNIGRGPYQGEDPTLVAIAKAGEQAPKVQVTASMLCYARELGRFHAQFGEDPPPDIQRFMTTRCGLTFVPQVANVDTRPFEGKFRPEEVTDPTAKAFQSVPDGALAGAWIGVIDGKFYFAFTFGFPQAKVEPLEMMATSGSVDVRGDVDFDFEWLTAYVSKGDLGHRRCENIPGEAAVGRHFAVRCDLDRGDNAAMIEVYAAPPKRLLGASVALLMVSPSGNPPSTYEAAVERFPVDSTDARPEARLAAINELRNRLGYHPLKLSAQQSESVEQLGPHVLAGKEHADNASLGLLAGWAVEGTIANGSLGTSFGNREWSLEREIAGQLTSPAFRARVLEQEADVYATAVVEDASRDLRARVEVTYELFEPRDYRPEETAIFDYVDAERAAAGLPPMVRVNDPGDYEVLSRSAEKIRTGASTPPTEAQALADHYAKATGHSFRALVLSPLRIDGWRPQFPDEFFSTPHMVAAMKVSYFQPEGAPWGQHVILVVYTRLNGPPQ